MSVVLAGYPELAQARWAVWRRRQLLDDRLPADFVEVMDAVVAFADPCLADGSAPCTWDVATGCQR